MLHLIVCLLAFAFSKSYAADVSCERIEKSSVEGQYCFMVDNTTIVDADVTLADPENNDVTGLFFNSNKKIEFLPVEVYKNFPNLRVYPAHYCSIREISARNFGELQNLLFIDLRGNQLKSIPNYCFSGLSKLSKLLLGKSLQQEICFSQKNAFADKNQIASLNGVAFANMPALEVVNLEGNVCIDKKFTSDTIPDKFRRKVSRNCASAESERRPITCTLRDKKCPTSLSSLNLTDTCCHLKDSTFIETSNDPFAVEERYKNVGTLIIEDQKYVEFLPVLVHEAFARLIGYIVRNTAIRMISKRNFEKLNELEVLWLEGGLLETIRSNTFEDLVRLRILVLRKKIFFSKNLSLKFSLNIFILFITDRQRLTALNGKAFENLKNLEIIGLKWNICSDHGFSLTHNYLTVANAPEIVTRQCGFEEFESKEVSCERYRDFDLYESCFLDTSTTIDSDNFVIADLKDEEVGAVIFNGNKKIEYLVLQIYKQFPNLYLYLAKECAIKQISKENFEKLNRLTVLNLAHNNIQKVRADTFNGVPNLSYIMLSE